MALPPEVENGSDWVLLPSSTDAVRDARRKMHQSFFHGLKPPQQKMYRQIDAMSKSLSGDIKAAKEGKFRGGDAGFYVSFLQKSLAMVDAMVENLGIHPGEPGWSAALALPTWLARTASLTEDIAPHMVQYQLAQSPPEAVEPFLRVLGDNGQMVTLYDVLRAIEGRIAAEVKKMPAPEREVAVFDFAELSPDEYRALCGTYIHQLLAEQQRDQFIAPVSAWYPLFWVPQVGFGGIEVAFSDRQPVVLSKGLTPVRKRERKQRYRTIARVMSRFLSQTVENVADDDNPIHIHAKRFVQALETIPGAQGFIKDFGPPFYNMDWITSLLTLAEETGERWYRTVVDRYIERLRQGSPAPYLFNEEMASVFSPTAGRNQDGQALQERINAFNRRWKNDLLLSVGKTTVTTDAIADLLSPDARVEDAYIRWFPGWFSATLQLASVQKPEDGPRALGFELPSLTPPDELFFDVIDAEAVPVRLRLAGAEIILRAVEREMSIREKDQGIADTIPRREEKPKVGFVIAPARPPRGPSYTPPKPAKRSIQPKGRTEDVGGSALYDVYQQRDIRPRLAVSDEELNGLAKTQESVLLARLEETLELYRRGGGVFKVLRHLVGSGGGHMGSLRVGRDYRAIFEIGEDNHGVLVDFFHRSNQDEVLAHYTRKNLRK